jgi:two-component system CheB/CheR fusion protein
MTDLPPTVGIGASAGGLEALREFIAALPTDSGLAYVVVQHLAPDKPSLMDKLLSSYTPLPITRIADGDAVAPDHVYLIPPGRFLVIEQGRFKLTDNTHDSGVRTPIDRFFVSLSEACGRSAFAVILSGTGSDGTMGVRAIKAQGGVAIVQESRSALFRGMPDSAAATGLVDFALRPRDIPGKILEIVGNRKQLEKEIEHDVLLENIEAHLDEIIKRIDADGEHSFAGYKPGTLIRRVARRMTLLRQTSAGAYLKTLSERADERHLLVRDFLIGVTEFFRDTDKFERLREEVLRKLLQRDDQTFRIWVPGCSTGEEAYSIAMLIAELMDETDDTRRCKIFGTDIDEESLRFARAGRYQAVSAEKLGEARLTQHFISDGQGWHVNARLREMCVFAPHNLLMDPPFSRLDLISCRNLMIYLQAESQAALLPRFHYALKPGGFLFLGPSETLGSSESYFTTVDRVAKIFQRDDEKEPSFTAMSLQMPQRKDVSDGALRHTSEWRRAGSGVADIESRSEQAFLRRHATPFMTVSRQNEVLYVSEAMTAFVRPSRGATSTDLEDYLTMELRLPVLSAIEETRQTGLAAEVRNVVVQMGPEPRMFDIGAEAFDASSSLILVALTEVRQRDMARMKDSDEPDRSSDYQQELLLTRRRLAGMRRQYESADQELRSANEELLSMNEELQSSNEELETGREELQSINEELETINSELKENNVQLIRVNSDLKNLLESTDIATFFVDQNDYLRLFTPEVERLFSIQERDIGRSIHDLARKIDYHDLQKDAAEVRQTLQPLEREVRIEATDETFAMRLRPYRTVDNRLDGVVVTFVDVTVRKRYEHQLEESARTLVEQYNELATLYDTVPIGLSLVDRDLRYLRINETLAAMNGIPAADHIGKLQSEILPEAHADVSQIQQQVLSTGNAVMGLEVKTTTPADPGKIREFIVDFYPVKEGEQVFALGSCVREVTAKRELERRITASAVRQRVAVDAAGLGVFEWNMLDDRAVWENDRMFEIFGRDKADGPLSLGDLQHGILHPEDNDVMMNITSQPSSTVNFVIRIYRNGGDLRYLEYFGGFENGSDGRAERLIGVVADITEKTLAYKRERDHQDRLQRLQNSLSAFVGLLDKSGRLVEVNATALNRGGLTREDVIGKYLWDCWWWSFSEESQERVRDAVGRAQKGEMLRYDVPARMADGQMVIIDFQLVPSFDEDGNVFEIVPSAVDVTERVRAEEQKDFLLAELEHRVKNTLATVQAITRFTARLSPSKQSMANSLVDRLAAMARTHDALTARDWQGQNLRALVESEIAPYADPGSNRFSYIGDDMMLEPKTVLSLGLALHELATNAAKYGAFSNTTGEVRFSAQANGTGFSRLEWQEFGGPPVEQPEHEGFGTFLVQKLLEKELGAEIDVIYDREGVRCTVTKNAEP